MTPTVILFTKAPRWGAVKSRLAARIGPMAALRFHRAQVGRMIRRLSTPRWRLVLAVTPDRARGPWTAGLPVLPQGRGDLGARMLHCLNRHRGPAVLIGSDIPGVTAAHISHALTLLRGADVVFGPAEDGGFWLLGLRRPLPEDTFAGVAWSTERTLTECVERVRRYRVAFAPCLADVDDAVPPTSNVPSAGASVRRSCTAGSGCRAE